MADFGEELAKTISPAFIDENKRFIKVQIDEIPIMQAEDGSIVCIPKGKETFTTAIVGNSGKGKSLVLHNIVDYLFWSWGVNVAIMNDISEETYEWSKPMVNEEFVNNNFFSIHEQPMPLPMVYIFQNTKDLSLNEDELKEKNYLRVTMPFREIIEDLGKYITGINPGFSMEKSGMYLNDIKEELGGCDTPIQVMEVLQKSLPGSGKEKTFQAMREKIMTAFRSLFNEQILDLTNPEYPSYLKCYNEKSESIFFGNPFSVLMKAGVIPSLITSDLSTKKYQSEVLAFHINSIFENHVKDFPNTKTFLVFDELRALCEEDNSSVGNALMKLSAMGRMRNIGLIYATQFYDKIPKGVKGARLDYCFCFQHSSNDTIKEIASDFNLDSIWKNQIKKLKRFQCIAMTKNKFIHYKDNERWEDSAPCFGNIVYPLSNHKTPE